MKKSGFTLIEVIVVMAIIAVLAALIVGAVTLARNTAKETIHRGNAKTLQAGAEAHYSKHRYYPYDANCSDTPNDTCSFNDYASAIKAGGIEIVTSFDNATECTGVQAGGGQVKALATAGFKSGYHIIPSNANCNGSLGVSDELKS